MDVVDCTMFTLPRTASRTFHTFTMSWWRKHNVGFKRARKNKAGRCYSVFAIEEDMHSYYLPADEVSLQEAELWYTTSRTCNTDRDLEVQNSRFVMDRYGRRMTPMSQSPSRTDKPGPSRMVFEGLRPAPLRLVVRGGGSSDRDTINPMTDPHPPTQDADGLRSNPIRLSRRAAVRASTRNSNSTTAERCDSKLSTRFPVNPSFHTSIAQPTPQPLSCLRRFSFEEDPVAFSCILAGRGDTTGSSTATVSGYVTPRPQNFPTPPIYLAPSRIQKRQPPRRPSPVFSSRPPQSLAEELQAVGERTPSTSTSRSQNFPSSPTLERQQPRRPSPVFSSRPQPCLAELQSVGGKTPTRENEQVVQRRIPTTFEEILGERNIPTALL
jgi:hypothetical protein